LYGFFPIICGVVCLIVFECSGKAHSKVSGLLIAATFNYSDINQKFIISTYRGRVNCNYL